MYTCSTYDRYTTAIQQAVGTCILRIHAWGSTCTSVVPLYWIQRLSFTKGVCWVACNPLQPGHCCKQSASTASYYPDSRGSAAHSGSCVVPRKSTGSFPNCIVYFATHNNSGVFAACVTENETIYTECNIARLFLVTWQVCTKNKVLVRYVVYTCSYT